jgi:DNA-directed RNA polymerase specialized sigma24 family protein
LVLRFYDDKSEAETADLLGCRPGTVGSLVHRGLAQLKKVTES